MTPQTEIISRLINEGFEKLDGHRSGIGATILINRNRRLVAKIGEDPAYGKYVTWAMNRKDSWTPVFHFHEEEQFDLFYQSTTVLEHLEELTPTEAQCYEEWYERTINEVKKQRSWNIDRDDPFKLFEAIKMIYEFASRQSVSVDLKSANLMARVADNQREFVIIDPFN